MVADTRLLKALLSRLTQSAFERFVGELFRDSQRKTLAPLKEAGDHVLFSPLLDSYGGSLHAVFIVQYLALDLFKQFNPNLLIDQSLAAQIESIQKLYKGQFGQWGMVSPYLKRARKLQSLTFITNLVDIDKEEYYQTIIPLYARAAKTLRLPKGNQFFGSYDSFVDLKANHVRVAFTHFLEQNTDSLRINLEPGAVSIRRIAAESHLSAGVLNSHGNPWEPAYSSQLRNTDSVLLEFEALLQKNVKESELERFLTAHYQLIFGPHYDDVATQIWLRFPESDISQRNRRFDMFLRNAITNDWELKELKRANVNLTGSVGDVPIFARQVTNALQQLRNYKRLLEQDSVRKKLALEGIEYFEPSLGLIIGRKPPISTKQWRWLLEKSAGDVKIATYDDLLKETRIRLADRLRIT